MKKILCLLLTFVLGLSLCACGNDSKQNDSKEKSGRCTTRSASDKEPHNGDTRNVITFDPEKIICEDENVKITALGFAEVYRDYSNTDPRWIASYSIKFHNKTDKYISVNVEDTYIKEDRVIGGHSTGEIKGGKSYVMDSDVELWGAQNITSVEKDYTSEDLYNLEGIFNVSFPDKTKYYIPFEFSVLK